MSREEAALVQLKLQLEALKKIAQNCLDTVKLLSDSPTRRPTPVPTPSRGRPGLLTDQVLAGMPAAIRPRLTAVLTSYGSVAITAPWLDPDEFAEVCDAVSAMGGSRIVAGRDSRWEVPVPAT